MSFKNFYPFILILLLTNACDKNNDNQSNETFKLAPVYPNKELLIKLVNEVRIKGCDCGGTYYPPSLPIVWNDTIEKVAKEHSQDMNLKNYFDHIGKDGSTPSIRLFNAGYHYTCCSENIAKEIPTEYEVIQSWLKSPMHCKNIMNRNYKQMGIATSGPYWTQLFAAH